MFYVDGEVVLSDTMEQVTADDDEIYNILVVESDKVPTYKKYSIIDNISDTETKHVNDEKMKISNKIINEIQNIKVTN